MGNKDRKKQKKKKQRQERHRQDKHRRKAGPAAAPMARGWDDDDDHYQPEGCDVERVQRLVAWTTRDRPRMTEQERAELVALYLRDDTWDEDYIDMLAADPAEAAQEAAFGAMEMVAEDRLAALESAQDAVRIDPDCIDAAVFIACAAEDAAERAAGTSAVLLRARQLPGVIAALAPDDGKADDRLAARPFLRALIAAAYAHEDAGDVAAAIACIDEVGRLDRIHGKNLAELRIGLLLLAARWDEARAAFVAKADDESGFWLLGMALIHAVRDERAQARRLIDQARYQDEGFTDGVIAGRPESASALDARSAQMFHRAWAAQPKALAWLREGAPLTTPTQRAEALASYATPVTGLLKLGDTGYPGPAREMIDRFGFDGGHVPELLRMVDDQALHDMPEDADGNWGPFHAALVLSELAGPGDLPRLLEIIPRRHYDEWTEGFFGQAIVRQGRAAIPAMAAWVMDGAHLTKERCFAARALGRIAASAGECRAEAIASMAAALRRHEEQHEILNTELVGVMLTLRAREHEPLIREVFASGRVMMEVFGSLEDALEELHSAPREQRG